MKAHPNGELAPPKNAEEFIDQIDAAYRKTIKREVTRAVALGGCAVWEILYDNYIIPIINAKTPEEKDKAVNELINKLEREGKTVKERKAEAQAKIAEEKAKRQEAQEAAENANVDEKIEVEKQDV